jgi:hypothetical protein
LKQQADIIQVFVKTYIDMHQGKGTAPAYSQVARTERLEDQAEQTIKAAEKDLLEEGIDKAVIVTHRDLIIEWLETVILPSEYDDEDGPADGPPATVVATSNGRESPLDPTDGRLCSTLLVAELTHSVGGLDPSRERPAELNLPIRAERASRLHNRSVSPILPVGENPSQYAANLVTKALRSMYSGRDGFTTLLNGAFSSLDKDKVGWLAPDVVEELCLKAISKTVFDFSQRKLVSIIEAVAESRGTSNHHIDKPLFLNIVYRIQQEFSAALGRRSLSKGLRRAALEIKAWKLLPNTDIVSPHWTLATRYQESANGRQERNTILSHKFGGDIAANQAPMIRNATYAIYLAIGYCVPTVESASQKLSLSLRNWTMEDEAEVAEVLTAVKKTAAQFARFGSPEGTNSYHWLDRFIEEASLVPISRFPDLQGCPILQGKNLVFNMWDVLDNILGLVSDIDYFSTWVPDLLHWREAGMLGRSRDLVGQTSHVLGDKSTTTFNIIKDWNRKHKETLLLHSKTCELVAVALKNEQQDAVKEREKFRFNVVSSLDKVPRAHFFSMC